MRVVNKDSEISIVPDDDFNLLSEEDMMILSSLLAEPELSSLSPLKEANGHLLNHYTSSEYDYNNNNIIVDVPSSVSNYQCA